MSWTPESLRLSLSLFLLNPLSTFIGSPVYLLIYAGIQSVNHVVAAQ